jgi:hypothetical protein
MAKRMAALMMRTSGGSATAPLYWAFATGCSVHTVPLRTLSTHEAWSKMPSAQADSTATVRARQVPSQLRMPWGRAFKGRRSFDHPGVRLLFTAKAESDSADSESPEPLTEKQKKILFISAAVPMIGFGFMDNMVMITMGEVIDSTMGVTFGLSTLTAAGFGQIFSDISGICFGGTVEAICTRLGLPTAKLTVAQAAMGQTKRITTFGAVCGVTVGCLLGMSILIFKNHETEDRKHEAEFHKMLEDEDKTELKEYVAKIREELAQVFDACRLV